MPTCKPGSTIELRFDDDASDAPLTFIVTELSFGQACDLEEKLTAIEAKTSREFADKLGEIIVPFIHGWKNGPMPEFSWDVWVRTATLRHFRKLPWMISSQIGYVEKKA